MPIDDGGRTEAKRHAPATLRNRDAIAAILERILPAKGRVLEVASGSGEHIVYFAKRFSRLEWQPSDPDPASRASVDAWVSDAQLTNVGTAIDLDTAADDWPLKTADAILCINMIHISPWNATEGLLRGAAQLLSRGAPLYLYGPFHVPGRETAPSNLDFDRSLKSRNPEWGLRSVGDIEVAAAHRGLLVEDTIDMPANNLSVVMRKR